VERLEAALAIYPGAILLVTHDDAFAARVLHDGPDAAGREGRSERWRIASGRVAPA
jgi:ATPase subunit of ABC transporter with duplicated ATPase domains